jgi:hypothetical protein
MHRSEVLYPVLAEVTGGPTKSNPYPMRRLDPSCRLRGWQELAAEVDRLRGQIRREDRERGIDPVLAGCNWTMPGELGVYCHGHPQAYSLGLAMGDRHSQYDLWENPIDDPAAFCGRTFLVVGANDVERLRAGFESVEDAGQVVHFANGQPLGAWPLVICRKYKGLAPLDAARH